MIQKLSFFSIIILNLDSVNIVYKVFKCGVVICDIIMEGTLSHIIYSGPSSFFYVILKMMFRIFQTVSGFWHEMRTKT